MWDWRDGDRGDDGDEDDDVGAGIDVWEVFIAVKSTKSPLRTSHRCGATNSNLSKNFFCNSNTACRASPCCTARLMSIHTPEMSCSDCSMAK